MKSYKITDLEVGIEAKPDGRTYAQGENYLSHSGAAHQFEISLTDEFLKQKQEEHPHLSFDDCEYLWTGFDFCNKLLGFKGFMLHSSAVAYENKAYLFSAPSGTGKSTHTEIWQRVFGEDKAVIINDDKPVIKLNDDKFYVYGTPWSGKTDKNLNIKVPLQGICFIERGPDNHIERVSQKDAIWLILNQTIRPAYTGVMDNLLSLIDELLKKVPVYRLRCNMEDEAAIVSYNGMKDGM